MSKKNKSYAKSTVVLIAVVVALALGITALLYTIFSTNTSPSDGTIKSDIFQCSNIIYLVPIVDTSNKNKWIFKKVFIMSDKDSTQILYLGDLRNPPQTWKKIHQLELGATQYGEVNSHGNSYFSMSYGGADNSDLIIFDIDGNIITNSLTQSNEELKNWALSYDSPIKGNLFKVNLIRVDGSMATAAIEASIGKIAPKSFKRLK